LVCVKPFGQFPLDLPSPGFGNLLEGRNRKRCDFQLRWLGVNSSQPVSLTAGWVHQIQFVVSDLDREGHLLPAVADPESIGGRAQDPHHLPQPPSVSDDEAVPFESDEIARLVSPLPEAFDSRRKLQPRPGFRGRVQDLEAPDEEEQQNGGTEEPSREDHGRRVAPQSSTCTPDAGLDSWTFQLLLCGNNPKGGGSR
jgi:hypothetical protein